MLDEGERLIPAVFNADVLPEAFTPARGLDPDEKGDIDAMRKNAVLVWNEKLSCPKPDAVSNEGRHRQNGRE